MVHDQMPLELGGGQTIAVLGTLPWGPCDQTDLNCHLQQRLGPGEVDLTIASVAAYDICEFGTRPLVAADPARTRVLIRIGGRPAIRFDASPAETDYYRSDLWRTWVIASPGTTSPVVIDGKARAPAASAMASALDRVIANLQISPDPGADGGATDCGAPWPPASPMP